MSRILASLLTIFLTAGPVHSQTPLEVEVDWTQAEGEFDRSLFSIQGFMQVFVEPDPMVMDTFLLMNPMGTQTRLETWIHQMEPENDNDDPNVFDWDRLYPEKMIRFIDDRAPFEKVIDELGMERLSLLCYNVDWLRTGDSNQPIRDNEEWAEFAAAVVETYNGAPGSEDYDVNLRLVQIWNEPNFAMFWDGTDEAFFELYNTAARRIRENYPGVLIGGPTITPAGGDIVDYMERFLAACGENTDFVVFHHYGPMGEGVDPITEHIELFSRMFRALPGKEDGKVMITETDAWFIGWEKMDFMLERQFRLMDIADLIMGIHHFCAMEYDESGNYAFGMVDEKGGVLPGTFWPYWLFRNTIGEMAPVRISEEGRLDSIATTHRNEEGALLASTVLRNLSEDPDDFSVTLKFAAEDSPRILSVERLRTDFVGVDEIVSIPSGADSHEMQLHFSSREAVALTLRKPGKRHFGFSDLNNQERPWMRLTSPRREAGLDDIFNMTARVTNTVDRPLNGTLRLEGMPDGWSYELLDGSAHVENLAVGQTVRASFKVTASSVPADDLVGVRVILDEGGENPSTAHSIPKTIKFNSPLEFQVLPLPIYAVAGEENRLILQIRNIEDVPIEGGFEIEWPAGISGGDGVPESFTQDGHSKSRFHFPLIVDDGTAPGTMEGTLSVSFMGASARLPFTVEIVESPTLGEQTPMDLTEHLNFDAVSFSGDRRDYDAEVMGMFVYPGDYTPSAVEVRTKGRLFSMTDLSDGLKNVIQPKGQRIAVEPGEYAGVNLLGFGHNGRHPGVWTLHYGEGTSTPVMSMIPEWCTPPPPGYEVAFTAPHRYVPDGNALPACELFFWTLPVDHSRELVAIEFPEIVHGYVFAMTLVGPTD